MNIHRDQVLYLVFGVLTTVVNYVVFYFATDVLMLSVLVSNTAAWVLAVLFAFITNRIFVFRSEVHGFANVFKECSKFFGGRLFSLGVESLLLWLMIDIIGLPVYPVKVSASVIVVLMNYLVSKFFVFNGGKKGGTVNERCDK